MAFAAVLGGTLIGTLAAALVAGVLNPAHFFALPGRTIGVAVGTGAAAGALTAVCAVLGGFLALLRKDRALERAPEDRIWLGSLGAGLGALVGWVLPALVMAVSEGEGSWLFFTIPIGLAAAVASGAIARAALSRSERAPACATASRERD